MKWDVSADRPVDRSLRVQAVPRKCAMCEQKHLLVLHFQNYLFSLHVISLLGPIKSKQHEFMLANFFRERGRSPVIRQQCWASY